MTNTQLILFIHFYRYADVGNRCADTEQGRRLRTRGGEGTWKGLSELEMEPLSAGPYKVQGLSVVWK